MLMDVLARALIYTALHFIGDFPFQSVWMVVEKGKSWEVLVYHCLTYTSPFVLMMLVSCVAPFISVWAYPLLFVSHFLIDACKARWGLIKTIWADQLWHLSMIALALALGWM